MNVYAYARWSSLEQSKGSTLERQLDHCRKHIERAGWKLASDPIVDRGRSAYTGANITSGNLGAFADNLRTGTIPTPATLVVEELDRLSRQPADVMLSWLSPLVRSGLTIIVTQTGQVIDARMLDHDIGTLMMILITAFGSNNESKKKSERGASAWETKRAKARAGEKVERHHNHPLWLRVNDEGEFEAIPERLAIVEDIFRLRLEGKGQIATAQWLNERRLTDPNYEVWARGRRAPQFWTPVYVGRTLGNRAVLGEWQPSRQPRGAKERTPVGEAIEGYYPAIIDPVTFAQANDSRITEQFRHQGRGRSVSNLFGKRARCGDCGGRMGLKGSIRKHRDGRQTRYYYLTCLTAKVAKSCSNHRTWAYDAIEQAVLDALLSNSMDDTHFRAPVDLTSQERAVYDAKAKAADIKTRMARLLDMMEAGDPMATQRYAVRKKELESAETSLLDAENELARLKGASSPDEHLRRVEEIRALVDSDDEEERYRARSLVKSALNDVIESIKFFDETGSIALMVVDRMRRIGIAHDGTIIDDLNLAAIFPGEVGPGYGRVERRFNGTVTYSNDLDMGQQAASKAYARRNGVPT
jgi:DNA invertase Pin-like site-specific DNA recombinase